MFEKTNEIINNSTPDSFLYELYGIKKNCSGFYQEDGNGCIDPFTYGECFETAKDAAEALYSGTICDEGYVEDKTGLRCERYALYKMTDEILDEFKNGILEKEYIYTQEQYDKKLSWAKEHLFFPNDPRRCKEVFPYWYLTEEFVKSWTYDDLLKYCEYNDQLYVGDSCLCKIGYYKDYIIVEGDNGEVYVRNSDYDQLEDYTPAEDIDDDDDSDDDE